MTVAAFSRIMGPATNAPDLKRGNKTILGQWFITPDGCTF